MCYNQRNITNQFLFKMLLGGTEVSINKSSIKCFSTKLITKFKIVIKL